MRNKSINGKFLRTRRMSLTNSFVCSCFIYHNLSKHCLIPNMFWYGFDWMMYLSAIKALSIDILADTKKDRSRVKTLLLRRSIIYFLVPTWHQQVPWRRPYCSDQWFGSRRSFPVWQSEDREFVTVCRPFRFERRWMDVEPRELLWQVKRGALYPWRTIFVLILRRESYYPFPTHMRRSR